MKGRKRLSTIGRPIDPTYLTNRIIAVVTILYMVGGVVFRWISGTGFFEGAYRGAGAGVAVFLAWALGRELDPDNDTAAFFGAGLTAIAVPFLNPPGLLILFWLLIMLRLVNRTTGLPATLVDSLGWVLLSLWMIIKGNWIVGLMTAGALVCDGILYPKQKRQLGLASIPLAATALVLIRKPDLYRPPHDFILPLGVVLLISLFFIPVLRGARTLRGQGDLTGAPLRPQRVITAQMLALTAAVLPAVFFGFPGVEMLMPFWAAVVGSALYVFVRFMFPALRNR